MATKQNNTIGQDNLFLVAKQEEKEKAKMQEDYAKWSIYRKLARAKVMLQKSGLKKTGYNPYDKFYYFDLGDFLPRTNEIFDELGMIELFNIQTQTIDGVVEETACLLIINIDNPDEFVEFTSPTAEPSNSRNPIQQLGSKLTYMRRYLLMQCLSIAETDMVDAGAGTHLEEKAKEREQASQTVEVDYKARPISKKQKDMLVSNFTLHSDLIKEELKAIGKSKFDELTMFEASAILQKVNAKNMENQNVGSES